MTAPVLPLIPDPAGIDAFLSGGVRWRVAPVPLIGEPPVPLRFHVYAENDFAIKTERVSGIDTVTGDTVLYHSTTAEAYFAAAPDAEPTAALGSFTVSMVEVGTSAVFIVAFEADDIDSALAGLADGAQVWCILIASGDFKIAVETIYHTARIAA